MLLGAHEAGQAVIKERDGVVEELQGESVLGRAGDAQKVNGAASGDDQVVIGEAQALGTHPLAVRVEAGHARPNNTDTWSLAGQGAQREGDGLGFQLGRGHLVEQGQEAVVVVPVNQDQVSRPLRQAAGGA